MKRACKYLTFNNMRIIIGECHTTFKNKLFTYETSMTAKADAKEDEKHSTFAE
jgi:hypothetical protein